MVLTSKLRSASDCASTGSNAATSATARASGRVSGSSASITAPDTASTYGRDGQEIVILLGGGTKKRQNADIEQAQNKWKQYKQEKH